MLHRIMLVAVCLILSVAALADGSVEDRVAEAVRIVNEVRSDVRRAEAADAGAVAIRRNSSKRLTAAQFADLRWIEPQLESLNAEDFMYDCSHDAESQAAICVSVPASNLFTDKGKSRFDDRLLQTRYLCQRRVCIITDEPLS